MGCDKKVSGTRRGTQARAEVPGQLLCQSLPSRRCRGLGGSGQAGPGHCAYTAEAPLDLPEPRYWSRGARGQRGDTEGMETGPESYHPLPSPKPPLPPIQDAIFSQVPLLPRWPEWPPPAHLRANRHTAHTDPQPLSCSGPSVPSALERHTHSTKHVPPAEPPWLPRPCH